MAPHARLPLVGECLGGLSVGTGYQSLASVRPGRTCNKHTHTHTHIEVAKARGVLDFWQRVQGFAEMGIPRRGWDGVGSDHPIIAAVGGRLQSAQPGGVAGDAEDRG